MPLPGQHIWLIAETPEVDCWTHSVYAYSFHTETLPLIYPYYTVVL